MAAGVSPSALLTHCASASNRKSLVGMKSSIRAAKPSL